TGCWPPAPARGCCQPTSPPRSRRRSVAVTSWRSCVRREAHQAWMRRALAVAQSGGDAADVPVGAVVYGPDGSELATGRNERELTGGPTAHAEIVALRRAAEAVGGWRLTGCTMVVTLEPCTMCAGALVL